MFVFSLLLSSLLLVSSCSQLKLIKLTTPEPIKKQKSAKLIWSKNFDPEYETGNMPTSFNSPFIFEDLLFAGSPTGKISAFQLENGREIWSAQEDKAIVGQPGVYKDQVLYGSFDGRIFSRDLLTGELKYVVDLGEAPEAPIVFYKDRALFHLRGHKIVCMDAETGKILWNYKRNIAFSPTVHGASTPYPIKNSILVGFADGHVGSLSLDDGILEWEQKISQGTKFIDVDISPIVIDKTIYASSYNGHLEFLRVENGSMVGNLPLSPSRAPILSDDQRFLFVSSLSGVIYKLNYDNNEILLEKRLTPTGSSLTAMVYWKSKNLLVVSSTKGKVFFISPDTLEIKDEFRLGSSISTVFGSIVEEGKILSLYSSRNKLYVFQ